MFQLGKSVPIAGTLDFLRQKSPSSYILDWDHVSVAVSQQVPS